MARTKAAPTRAKRTEHFVVKNVKKVKKERKDRMDKEKKKLRSGFIIPKTVFSRVVKEIALEVKPYTLSSRWSTAALNTLQEVSEIYLAKLFQDSYLVTLNRKAQTLAHKDLCLTRRLRNEINIPPPGGWKSGTS